MTRVLMTLGAVAAAQIAVAFGPTPLGAQSPLFTSHEPLDLTLRAPFEEIFAGNAGEAVEHPGVVVVHGRSGDTDTLEVEVRTRGFSRRQVCEFPPLRLDFPRSRVAGTVFAGQDKLKLVTHCQDDGEEYEQYVLLESLIYRAYNTLTPLSFRVRLARIGYEDSGGDRRTVTRYGFLIEHEAAVAERTGWLSVAAPLVPPDAMDPENLALVEVFQYMIGNLDWSAFQPGPGSSECCQNTKPMGAPVGPVFTLPYDFDLSGLVNPRYADRLFGSTLQKLRLPSVRRRRYRGLCRSAELWPAVFARFVEHRDEIEDLFRDQEGLDPGVRADALEYIGDFYDLIVDGPRARRDFERHCVVG